MKSVLANLATLLFALSSACASTDHACTAEARSSVTVTVLDADGSAVNDADVKYSLDGAEQQACMAIGNTYACAFERTGAFVVTATRGDMSAKGAAHVGQTADGCHVEGQLLTLQLAE